ncbi:hypothetical protein BLFGPEAP_00117 [Candidatus Methanoperedenaceae archaeon GB50]|nr:hypothetical protein BLFGPEAP_00117 [Candidatus Methanoperedenaceae archaeon GB50]
MTRLFFLKSVFQFLKTYKKRTILSMLGVLFGIFSLVAVGNISSAMNQKVKETLDKFGPNLLIIRAWRSACHRKRCKTIQLPRRL